MPRPLALPSRAYPAPRGRHGARRNGRARPRCKRSSPARRTCRERSAARCVVRHATLPAATKPVGAPAGRGLAERSLWTPSSRPIRGVRAVTTRVCTGHHSAARIAGDERRSPESHAATLAARRLQRSNESASKSTRAVAQSAAAHSGAHACCRTYPSHAAAAACGCAQKPLQAAPRAAVFANARGVTNR
jgi:hypothetical protein